MERGDAQGRRADSTAGGSLESAEPVMRSRGNNAWWPSVAFQRANACTDPGAWINHGVHSPQSD